MLSAFFKVGANEPAEAPKCVVPSGQERSGSQYPEESSEQIVREVLSLGLGAEEKHLMLPAL